MSILAVFAYAVLGLSVVVPVQPAAQVPSPWDRLQHRTGWIYLGELKGGRWATQVHHVVKKGSARRVVPRIGNVLELTDERVAVYLTGFQTHGERDRLIAPADRPLEPEDSTGVWLEPGSLVVVRAVHIEKPAYGLSGLWVRVSPAP